MFEEKFNYKKGVYISVGTDSFRHKLSSKKIFLKKKAI